MRSDVPEDRMEHIDEGTIHAWLDGVLSADEGARLEGHVASCAACAAAVAEARGLIAASSRILSALDDVPGGVIPVAVVSEDSVTPTITASNDSATDMAAASGANDKTRVAGAATSSHVRSTGRRAHRPWYVRPQWAAAAGITFLAVAATAVWPRSGAPTVLESASERTMAPAPIAASAADRSADTMQPAAEAGAARARTSDAPTSSAPQAPKALASRADAASSNEQKSASGAGAASAAPASAVPEVADVRKEVAAKSTRTLQGDSLAQDVVAAAERDQRRAAQVAAAPPPAALSATAAARDRSAIDTSAAKRVGSVAADAITRSESARAAGEAIAQRKAGNSLAQVTTTGASAGVTHAAPPLGAPIASRVPPVPASFAGCYRLQPADVARAAGWGELLQLEFAGAGSDEARPAYAARELGVRNVQPATARQTLRWTLSSSGEVVLVRGEGADARRVTLRLDVPVDSLAPQQLQGTRTVCPSR